MLWTVLPGGTCRAANESARLVRRPCCSRPRGPAAAVGRKAAAAARGEGAMRVTRTRMGMRSVGCERSAAAWREPPRPSAVLGGWSPALLGAGAVHVVCPWRLLQPHCCTAQCTCTVDTLQQQSHRCSTAGVGRHFARRAGGGGGGSSGTVVASAVQRQCKLGAPHALEPRQRPPLHTAGAVGLARALGCSGGSQRL